MATNDDVSKALLIAGFMGLGAIGALAYASNEKKRSFEESLQRQLAEFGLDFVVAELSRGPEGELIWLVTLNHPDHGAQRYALKFGADDPPYEYETLRSIVTRITKKAFAKRAAG